MQLFTCRLRCGFQTFPPHRHRGWAGSLWAPRAPQRNISGSHLEPAVVTKERFGSPQDIFFFLKPSCKANSGLSIITYRRERALDAPSPHCFEHWRENLTHFEENEPLISVVQEFFPFLGTVPTSAWGIYSLSIPGRSSLLQDRLGLPLAAPKAIHSHPQWPEGAKHSLLGHGSTSIRSVWIYIYTIPHPMTAPGLSHPKEQTAPIGAWLRPPFLTTGTATTQKLLPFPFHSPPVLMAKRRRKMLQKKSRSRGKQH